MSGGWWEYLVGDELCSFFAQISQGVEREEAAASPERSRSKVLGELLNAKWPESFFNCVKK